MLYYGGTATRGPYSRLITQALTLTLTLLTPSLTLTLTLALALKSDPESWVRSHSNHVVNNLPGPNPNPRTQHS